MVTYVFHNAINVTKTTFLSKGLNYYQIKLDDTNYGIMGVLLHVCPWIRRGHSVSSLKWPHFSRHRFELSIFISFIYIYLHIQTTLGKWATLCFEHFL